MYTRRLVLAAVLVLAIAVVVAQAVSSLGMQPGPMQGRGPGMHRGMGHGVMSINQMNKALNLTPDQVSKIRGIHQNARAQRQSIMADTSLTPDARRAKLMDLAKTTHQQVMAVLTPDQQAKYQQLRTQRKAQRFDQMSSALALTPTQQTQVKAIKDKERADIKAVLGNTSLTRDQKVAQIKQIRSASRDQMRALLTPEQRAKFDAFPKRAKAGRAGAGPKVVQPAY